MHVGATNIVKIVIHLSGFILAMDQHLMEQVHGIMVMTLPGMF